MDLVQIGRLRKPFGVDGRLRFEVEEAFEADFSKADVIFLQRPDGQLPYFVESILYDEPATIKLEDVNTKEAARELSMSPLSLRAEDISVEAVAAGEGLAKLAGFLLIDQQVEVGRIIEVREYPQQLMAVVMLEGQEILIPLVEDLITSIDAGSRVIHCELPEGLVEAQMS